ncbi:MAG: hypothetical protein HGA44_02850 [Cellulomonadaceae bacterium]|nr:hypothetical protein [Cellulomonadaceae bacterium]
MSEPELAPVAVVLTQVAAAEGLAAACAMNRVLVDAVPSPIGALAVCRSVGPGEPELAARAISRVLANTPVVLVVQRGGQLTATRWVAGEPGDVMAPGLLLDGAPDQVEQLLLGQLAVGDLPGVVSSQMSRWRATRLLAAAARAARRPGRPG